MKPNKNFTELYDLLLASSAGNTDWLQPVIIPKGRILVEIGDVSDKLYWLKKGVMRAYYFRGFEDITAWLAADGEIACLPESFFQRSPSLYLLEAMEDCQAYSIPYEKYRGLCQQDIRAASLVVVLLEDYLVHTANQVKQLRYLSVDERIAHYLKEPGSLFRRVPDRHIATLLGTTDATFSRCLKRIYKRGQ
jgi:CRP-like cAMP-binding protein